MQPISPDNPDKPQDIPYEPRLDYLLVEVISISESKIVMPDEAQLPLVAALVIKKGPGRTLEFNGAVEEVAGINPGDVVLMGAFNPMYAPVPVQWRDHELLFIRAREVVGVRTDAPWGVKQQKLET